MTHLLNFVISREMALVVAIASGLVLFSIHCEYEGKRTIVDLSHPLSEYSRQWPTEEPFVWTVSTKEYTTEGYWYEAYRYCFAEHTGTHLDAPSHFAKGKWTVDQIPLQNLHGPGRVIDLRDKVAKDPNAVLSKDDFMFWLDDNGPLPDGVILFIKTGWASRYDNKTAYYGSNTSDTSNLIFPGISPGAAQLIANYESVSGNKISGVGLDAPSLDYGPSKDFMTHRTLYEANIYGLENIANLNELPMEGFDVIVMPIKVQGGSGGPVRIVAMLNTEKASSTSVIIAKSLLALSLILYIFACFK